MGENFYGDLRVRVLYRSKDPSDRKPIVSLYEGTGMHPQFILPNMEAVRNLREALSEIIAEEEIPAKPKSK